MKTPRNQKANPQRRILNVALFAIILAGHTMRSAEPAANGDPKQTSIEDKTTGAKEEDRAKCKDNLLKLSAAIEAYRKDHKELPNWLSDLVPNYVADTNYLICLIALRNRQAPPGMKDPKIANVYHYEFNPSRIGADVQSFWGETEITMREW